MQKSKLKMLGSKFLAVVTGLGVALSTSNCGSDKKIVPPDTQSQRTGRDNTSSEFAYFDGSARLSGSGTSLVFTSGRDAGTSRIYKTTFTADAWATPSKLSTSSGMTTENIAKLSPNGTYVLVQGATATGQILSFCVFATGVCTSLTTTPWGFAKFEFAPDSGMFYYLTGTKSQGATLNVADVNSGTPASTKVGATDTIFDGIWATNSSLISTTRSSTVGMKVLTARTFTTAAAAATATATDFSATISFGAILDDDSASLTTFSVAVPLKPSASKVFTEFGTIDAASKKSIPLINELHSWNVAGVDSGATSASLGFEVVSSWTTADNTTNFSLNRIATRCTGDGNSIWGYGIAVTTLASSTVTWRHLKKPIDMNEPPTLTTDPCDRLVGTESRTQDFGPSALQVNASATATTHTLVWTSDMTGDPEIFASVTTAAGTTVYNVSKNRKP